MIRKKIYDILDLHKLDPEVRNALALSYGVDTENKDKRTILMEILDAQSQWNNDNTVAQSPLLPIARRRVYLVAKVSGLPADEVADKYEKARKIVESRGYEAVIPIDVVPINSSWHCAMRILIPIMLGCDAYTLIDEPYTTAGGLVEDTIATWVQLPKITFCEL